MQDRFKNKIKNEWKIWIKIKYFFKLIIMITNSIVITGCGFVFFNANVSLCVCWIERSQICRLLSNIYINVEALVMAMLELLAFSSAKLYHLVLSLPLFWPIVALLGWLRLPLWFRGVAAVHTYSLVVAVIVIVKCESNHGQNLELHCNVWNNPTVATSAR